MRFVFCSATFVFFLEGVGRILLTEFDLLFRIRWRVLMSFYGDPFSSTVSLTSGFIVNNVIPICLGMARRKSAKKR